MLYVLSNSIFCFGSSGGLSDSLMSQVDNKAELLRDIIKRYYC